MHVLTPARDIPQSPRYFTIDLPEKGAHAFKMPTYGVIDRVTDFARVEMASVLLPVTTEDLIAWEAVVVAHKAEHGDSVPPPEAPQVTAAPDFVAVREVVSAALVGAAWFHRGMVLDTPTDLSDLRAYGAAVADELQDRGYNYAEIGHLGDAVRTAMITYYNAGMNLKSEAIAAGKP